MPKWGKGAFRPRDMAEQKSAVIPDGEKLFGGGGEIKKGPPEEEGKS
jgi:hypothetical protein